jgi:hypothetical protein
MLIVDETQSPALQERKRLLHRFRQITSDLNHCVDELRKNTGHHGDPSLARDCQLYVHTIVSELVIDVLGRFARTGKKTGETDQ